MAFIGADSDKLARELWPQDCGILRQDAYLDMRTAPPSRIVPSDVESLADWMFVELDADGWRGKVYVKGEGDGEDESSELVLRLQGVVHDMDLNLTGDWNRSEQNAKKAAQGLCLVSGGCTAAFEPQRVALAKIRETVGLVLGLCPSTRRGRSNAIVLRRRVFTKVVGGKAGTESSAVLPGEDVTGDLERMSARWQIVLRLRCGVQDEEGDIVHFNPSLIRPGDLVDVSVTVAVVLKKTSLGRKYDVIFEPCTVVRLRSAGSMRIVLHSHRERRAAQVGGVKAKAKMVEGFTFHADRGDCSSAAS